MIKVSDLSYAFPDKELYDEISFTLEKGERCALIGSSGNGKSTLIKLIAEPDRYLFTGELEREEGVKFGFVAQFYELDKEEERTVFEYIAHAFLAIEEEIEEHCMKMESGENIEQLLEEYQGLLDRQEAMGGDQYDSLIRKKLALAGLQERCEQSVFTLSGGEFKLVQVVKQMLSTPDCIIMDEPDSFLDFEHLEGLRDLISAYKGTLLVITHNRYLLNHCFNKILHLENKKIQEFEGGYIEYNFKLLENKIELEEQATKDTEELERSGLLIENLREIAENSDSASNGRSLRARVSYHERLEARRTQNPFLNIKKPQFRFEAEEIIEDEFALVMDGFNLEYSEKLLNDVKFEIKPTDKVGIIGGNGTGKTSLLREIYQNNHPAIHFAQGVTLSYLSQNHDEMFDGKQTIFELFFELNFPSYDAISDYLDGFGFPRKKLENQIASLSGGEKNTLGLAILSHKKSNFLILDEPTSHLDTYGQIAFEEGMVGYQGGVLMISHDFYTLSNCMDYLLILEDKAVRKMQLRKFRKKTYANNYTQEYLALEQKKKQLETKIETAIYHRNTPLAREVLEELSVVIEKMI